jgi:uncharacterized protein YktB (UPF0637 family)
MADFHHNIFYYYRGTQQSDRERERQLEDNTTKALINTLKHCDSKVTFEFLGWLGIKATKPVTLELQKAIISKGEIGNKSQRLLLGIVPTKEIKNPCAELGRTAAGEKDSFPDAWIYGDNFVVLVESKVEGKEGASLELDQMERHYQKLLVDTEQQPDCRIHTWAEAHRFFKNLSDELGDELTPKDKWLIEQFTQYLEWIGMAEFIGLEQGMFNYFATCIDDRNEDDRRWVRGTMRSFAEKILEGLQAVDSSFYQDYDVGRLLLKDDHCWTAFGPKDKNYRRLAHQTVSLHECGLDVFVNVELKDAIDRLRKKIAKDKQMFREIVSRLPGPFSIRVEERKPKQASLYDYHRVASSEAEYLKDPELGSYGFHYVETLLKRVPLPCFTVRRCIDRDRALELSQRDGRPLIEEVVGIMKVFHPLVEFINE